MDMPLLALTRRKARPPLGPSPDTMADNMRQLVQLRWIAVAGQIATILIVGPGLGVPLPMGSMMGIAGILALANLIIVATLSRRRVTNLELTLSLLLDMAALAGQLYLSGGSGNPFALLFLLQVVLGAILLKPWSVWVLVAAAALAYGFLGIAYVPLLLPPSLVAARPDLFATGAWIGFVLAAVLLSLFIARISRNLKTRDWYLGELRSRAAEEEGFVRTGLFLSGAAHELGTPLGTLSVILGDWRRMPEIASDKELAGDVEEMRAEVERCKTLVGEILRSAGAPRGEAMALVYAVELAEDLARDWREARPDTVLALDQMEAGSAMLAGEPSLRQAVWNLLENAAEVSPDAIELDISLHAGEVLIAVRDEGPGFDEQQLEHVGRPFHSTKGAGRGVGLFLVANVARQLGGRIEASNLEGGGAEVKLVLPAAIRSDPEP